MLGSKSTEEPKSNKENVAVVEINQSDLGGDTDEI
jgi:hypothetical protein